MVIDTMLMINNFRDREEDRRCNKRTIVVCLGAAAGRWGYLALGTGAILLCLSLLAEGRIATGSAASALPCSPYRHMAQDGTHRPRRRTERLPGRNGPQHPALRRPADRRHPARQKSCADNRRHLPFRINRTSQRVSCPISEIPTIPTQSRTQRPSHGRPTAPSPETDRPQTIDLPDRDSPASQKKEGPIRTNSNHRRSKRAQRTPADSARRKDGKPIIKFGSSPFFRYLHSRSEVIRQSLHRSPHNYPCLSLSSQKIGGASENWEQVPVFSRLSLSLSSCKTT